VHASLVEWSCFYDHCVSDIHFMHFMHLVCFVFFIQFTIILISLLSLSSLNFRSSLLNLMTLSKKCIANLSIENNWRQRPIEAYDISNQLTSYRVQSYDQNKLSFDSIASQMTASQVKNRNLKFSALTQIKIDDETRVH